jgi:DNA-binding HxlR family transcriptional regulator
MKLEKITSTPKAARRTYEDACGTAHALDLIGERWALLVMRELLLGPKRFSDLRADLPGISANVLTQRLAGLEETGLVVRRKLPPPAAAQVYELTDWGYESEIIIQQLGRWATRSPLHDPSQSLSGTSLMLSFRTMFAPDRAGDFAGSIGFRIGHERYRVTIQGGKIEAVRGDPEGADAILTGAAPMVAAIVYGGVPIDALTAEGALQLEGDRALVERFATLFPLPPKVGSSPTNVGEVA